MGSIVITKIADNIISPLGLGTRDNFNAVLAGKTGIRNHIGSFGLPEPFCASLLNRDEITHIACNMIEEVGKYTFFEKLCILSAKDAIDKCGILAHGQDVLFVLSTTKGNVEYLTESQNNSCCYLAESAKKIANYFGNTNTPVVVSNACVSGVCAQIAAVRELLGGRYSCVVVIGCDVLSKFIISGFQSFKALSPENCRPYDKNRLGLNLGEAAGTIILKSEKTEKENFWYYAAGSIHNDANHISGPSRTGEGSYRVLKDILRKVDVNEIGFVNAHGTATAYNDEMESIAIHRAGLDEICVNGLKGYYGHTLGAAGIIETILSMQAIDNGVVLGTKGFETSGTSFNLNISNKTRETSKNTFVKILSGFGGSNAGISYRKGGKK